MSPQAGGSGWMHFRKWKGGAAVAVMALSLLALALTFSGCVVVPV